MAKKAQIENGTKPKAPTAASTAKTPTLITKESQRDLLSDHIEKLARLKSMRDQFLKKKIKLEAALDEIEAYQKAPKNDFVGNDDDREEWNFEIVLQKGINSHSKERIFAINQETTVARFTQFLTNELNVLLESYNQEIDLYFKSLKE